ncbi:TraB/GumN family protein [Acidimangrovimonas pyrenivorans]|uniref:TraB/GumN family protein n=1 Tax=Acidimangrovimonas pyrenivorans TaxID=2030798 RepID=A0ABV7ALX7_9RHOB
MSVFSVVARVAVTLLLLAAPGASTAACHGKDLLAGYSDARKAALVGDAPYATGNVWRATRGDASLTLIGTYHLPDPRFDALMPRLTPLLRGADALLVEAGPKEEAALKSEMTSRPEILFLTEGPTLPERLDEPTWQALVKAVRARGIPPFLAAKMRPWYLTMLLSVPPCARAEIKAAQSGGLDKRLIAAARARGIPVRALEPHDTALRAFDAIPFPARLDMLRATVATDGNAADLLATTASAYFAGQHRLIWAFSQHLAVTGSGLPPGRGRAAYAQIDRHLVTDRNRAWIPVLERAAAGHHVVAAFGAGHLGGRDGVLNLLHRAGFTLTRLEP